MPPAVDVKIIERNGSRTIVRRLGGATNDCRRAQMLYQLDNSLAVSDVEFVMHEVGNLANQTLLIQSRIALGAKKTFR